MPRRAVSWMLSIMMLFALLPLHARADEPIPEEEPLPAEETLIPEETAPPEETEPPEETATPELSPEPTETPAPEPGLAAFAVPEPLPALPFADVPSGAWYFDAVQKLYALRLVSGVSSTAFSPSAALTAGQCAALSVRIYAAYHGAEIDVTLNIYTHMNYDRAAARRILAQHGIFCEGKRARRLTKADYQEYDCIIGMDSDADALTTIVYSIAPFLRNVSTSCATELFF